MASLAEREGHDPYKALKTTLKGEIDPDAWVSLRSDLSRPFDRRSPAVSPSRSSSDEVMKVFRV